MTEGKKSQATIMVELALDSGAMLFRTSEHKTFAAVPVDGHIETLQLSGNPAKRYLARHYHAQTGGGVPGSQATADALAVLQGIATHEGDVEDVHLRTAEHDGDVYIDLGDPSWSAVKVTRDGWEIVTTPPVYFRRPKGMTAMPVPVDGNIDKLDSLLNLDGDIDFKLVKTVNASYLFPTGPYPVSIINGEQGSAKSYYARIVRGVIDPSAAPLRSLPRDERDLMIAANNAWLLNFDNVSDIRPWLSDAMCRLATGAGFTTRALYTDDDEVIFTAARPIMLNGISNFVTRGDLADRSINFTLPYVPVDKRRDDDEVMGEFNRARPAILGGILDLMVEAMKNEKHRPNQLPRMATFARRGYAMAPALNWTGEDFMEAYTAKTHEAGGDVLEDSLITSYIIELAVESWEGTASELLDVLNQTVPDKTRTLKAWPKRPNVLSGELRRLAPALRAGGVEVEFSQTSGAKSHRLITIRQVTQKTDATDATDASDTNSASMGVDGVDGGVDGASMGVDGQKASLRYESDDGVDGVDGKRDLSKDDVSPMVKTAATELGAKIIEGG